MNVTLPKKLKIIVGITGGIAAYKAIFLIRELTLLKADVRVVMSESAKQFVSPLTLQALGALEVRHDLFDLEAEAAMSHIELATWGDYLVIAPATANCLAKFANGLADDLLSTIYLVFKNPVIICPAMNESMWQHQAVIRNKQILSQRGVIFVGPDHGWQACGTYGRGRLSETIEIINALILEKIYQLLKDKKVLITAGPTYEAIDPVRFIGNYSSGKMGYALAQAAFFAGAEVILISGPTTLSIPSGVQIHYSQSAIEMQNLVIKHLKKDMLFISAAAIADYRPAYPVQEKIKKEQINQSTLTIELIKNPDILTTVVNSGKASMVIGFALETHDLVTNAYKKLTNKKLDMIIANQVGINSGFNGDNNQITIITKKQQITLPAASKIFLAGEIIKAIAESLPT